MKEKQSSVLFIIAALIVNFINARYFGAIKGINLFYMGQDYLDFLAYIVGSILGIAIVPIGLSIVVSLIFSLKKDKHAFMYYFSVSFLVFSFFSLFINFPAQSPFAIVPIIAIVVYIVLIYNWAVSKKQTEDNK